MNNFRQTVKDVFTILQATEKRKLWILAVLDMLISVLDIAFLIGLLYVIKFYTEPIQTAHANALAPALFYKQPALLITGFFVLFATKNTAGFIISKMQIGFVYDVASRIARDNMQQYLDCNYQDYVNIDSSVTNRKISQEPIEFCHYVLNGVQQIFSQSILVVITTVAVLLFNPLLFPLLLIILSPPVVFITFLMKRKLENTRLYGKTTSEKTIQHLQEALSGYIESNLYKKNDFFLNRYHRLQARLNQYLSERLIIQNMPPRLIEVFAVFGLLVLVLLHLFTTNSHSLPLVTIGALMVAAYKIIPGIVKITNTAGQVKTYSFTAADLAASPSFSPKLQANETPIGSIDFRNVCFNYPDKPLIDSLSFTLKRGDFAVVSGISGKGKTTLINLLLGFLEPATGSICINGLLTDTTKRQQYWPAISYVRQQSFFLHASLLENISFQEQFHDTKRMKQVTALTGIDRLVRSLTAGLETMITENGKNFSGGQRQRIGFARALYQNFDLLILDESFNELDELSEIEMLDALQKIAASGKIIILVTHNTAALAFANKKIYLDD